MIYADTDFFIALIKKEDWLKVSALKILKKYESEITTSAASVAEILLVSKRFQFDPELTLAAVFAISPEVEGIDSSTALLAAHYIKEKNLNVFDALHAAYSKGKPIISSDKVYDLIGLERISLDRPA